MVGTNASALDSERVGENESLGESQRLRSLAPLERDEIVSPCNQHNANLELQL
jgi:hypothetical protein